MNAVTTSWQCFSWYFLWMIAMLSGWDEDKSSTTSIPLARRLSWSWLKENCPLLGSHRKLLFSLGNNADCWCFCEITSLVFEILSVASKNRDRVQSVMVRRVLRIAKFKNALYLWIKLIIRFDDDNVDILNSLYLSKARKCKGRVYVNNPNSLHHLTSSSLFLLSVCCCWFQVWFVYYSCRTSPRLACLVKN